MYHGNIYSRMIFCYLFVFFLQLSCSGANEYVTRIIAGKPRHCLPYYNCQPGHEIMPCIDQYTTESCRSCHDNASTNYEDYVQPDYISSTDGDLSLLRCFKPLVIDGDRSACTAHDVTYDRVDRGDKEIGCRSGRGCKCDLNACFYGDPCFCNDYKHENGGKGCDPGYHLIKTGACVPCPAGTVKNESGCGPCWRVPSNISGDQTTAAVTQAPTKQPTPSPQSTTRITTVTITTQKPTTTQPKTTVKVDLLIPPTQSTEKKDDSSTTVGIIVGVILALIILFVIVAIFILHRKGKLARIKTKICCAERRQLQNEVEVPLEEEMQPLNEPEEVQNNMNEIRMTQGNNCSTNKPINNNITHDENNCPSVRFHSDSTTSINHQCPNVKFHSGSSASINRQLSNVSGDETLNSETSERCPSIEADPRRQILNRFHSVPNPSTFHGEDSVRNPHVFNRAESVPQQVSENGHNEYLINGRHSSSQNALSQLVPSPSSSRPFLDMGRGACVAPLDFDNIQTSNPVMNTELPNICDFKRSLSKDSSSSADLTSGSPFNSIPEETGKEIQDEVVGETHHSGVTLEEPHLSEAGDYSDCHLSQYADTPQDSDITNQIDSRLEQYNHTVAGTDEGATCSVLRLPSEHEEETMKKKDLESTLDSGMALESSDLKKTDSV